jgi:hypothetical protein
MRNSYYLRFLFFIALVMVMMTTCKKDEDDNDPNSVIIVSLNPDSPATLNFGDFVVILTDYNITDPLGARIWVQPYTAGEKSPGYVYSSSGVFKGSGNREVGITVRERDDPEVVVDQLRIICTSPDQSETILEEFIDVNYTFSNNN